VLLFGYYLLLRPRLADPSVHALARQRAALPAGGVLRQWPPSASRRARLPGAALPLAASPPPGLNVDAAASVAHSAPCAFVFVLWHDDFVLPALVSIRSLFLYGTAHDVHVLVCTQGALRVGQEGIDALEMLGARITKIPDVYTVLDLPRPSNEPPVQQQQQQQPREISSMFLKLEAWKLTEYQRVLLVDADTVANTNIDALLLAADCMAVDLCTAGAHRTSVATSRVAQNLGPMHYFNAGFLHLKPSIDTFNALVVHARGTPYLRQWAYEQDFLNLMVSHGVLSHRQIRPVGHLNKFPATQWVHFTSGKPWGWRSYPVHVPWTPRRKYWGIVRSWQWMSMRYTLPGSCSLLTLTALWAIGWPVALLACVWCWRQRQRQHRRRKHAVEQGRVVDPEEASPHRTAVPGHAPRTSHEHIPGCGWDRAVTLVPVAVLWVFCIGAPRMMYDPGVLLPDTLAPTTAWVAVALNTACVVTVARPDACTLYDSLRIASTTLVSVCVVTVLELMHVRTSPWGLPAIFLSTLMAVDMYVNRRQVVCDALNGGWRLWRGSHDHSKRY
jgi:lipopolysaccharide biosynthesis glycosyltransferase